LLSVQGSHRLPQDLTITQTQPFLNMPKPPHYVIVVHGIGEQRKNETTLKVVERYAASRRLSSLELRINASQDPAERSQLEEQYTGMLDKIEAGRALNVLTLGRASGATGIKKEFSEPLQWIEIDGIPQDRGILPEEKEPFLGERIDTKTGENFRFVDVCWSDILDDDEEAVVQDILPWAEGLLGRLQRKGGVPQWIQKLLVLLIQSLLLVQQVMKLRFSSLEKLIFGDFLGDVQQYGEYTRARGRGAYRFHKLIGRIEQEYQEEKDEKKKPRYTIVAHSLGTIMSFDALVYARIRASFEESEVKGFDGAFWGYNDQADHEFDGAAGKAFDPTETDWINRVGHFVTLGSPIDKYLVLWWQNYRYLTKPFWNKEFKESFGRIKHLNYCDELDPVGHNLDVVKTSAAYVCVFESVEDVVFNRYKVPGVAHNEYWGDQRLFDRILRHTDGVSPSAVGTPPKPNPSKCEEEKADEDLFFEPALIKNSISQIYQTIPWVIILLEFVTLSAALNASSALSLVAGSVALALTICFGRGIMDLSLWWRRILIEKQFKREDERNGDFLQKAKWKRHDEAVRSALFVAIRNTVIYVLGAAVSVSAYFWAWGLSFPYSLGHLTAIASIVWATAIVFHRISSSSLVKFESSRLATGSNDTVRSTAWNRWIADIWSWGWVFLVMLGSGVFVTRVFGWGGVDAGRERILDTYVGKVLQDGQFQDVMFHLCALLIIVISVFGYRNIRFGQIRAIALGYKDRGKPLDFEDYAGTTEEEAAD
jgi:hypothetical protein